MPALRTSACCCCRRPRHPGQWLRIDHAEVRARAQPGAPEPDPQDSRNTYLELIERMQQQGAWYASLAHVEAFRQRYGDRPALRLLQADALRETGQADAAVALYRELSSGRRPLRPPMAWA
jgi:hypothetical protein